MSGTHTVAEQSSPRVAAAVRDLIALAVVESDGARREELLRLADEWVAPATNRTEPQTAHEFRSFSPARGGGWWRKALGLGH